MHNCQVGSNCLLFMFAVPMIQNLEATLRAGAVPQAPQFTPTSLAHSSPSSGPVSVVKLSNNNPSPSTENGNVKGADGGVKAEEKPVKSEGSKAADNSIPPAVKPAETREASSANGVANGDPLGDARSKLQEEITREFAAIMASGTLRASEAAALATKRVMQRYGHLNVAMPQS